MFVAGLNDGNIRIWNITNSETPYDLLSQFTNNVYSLESLPNGIFVSGTSGIVYNY
jgi:WD40 repeat protein